MAKRVGAASKWARGDQQTNLGILNFWITFPKDAKTLLLKVWGLLFMNCVRGLLPSNPSSAFPDPAVWKSNLPREWRIAMPASLMRVGFKI